jgi:uncharacterized membrane protein YjjB (DUF3815 family)
MDSLATMINSLWAGLFAASQAVLLSAPARAIAPSFFCGLAGRFVRDLLVAWGVSQNWSTVVGATAVVLTAVAFTRRQVVAPVILIGGVLPLGASVAMFNAIVEMMKASSLRGEALGAATVAMTSNVCKVFTTTLAIAVGLGVGIAITRCLKRGEQ